MAIDDNTSYELTGYQVKDLAQKIRAKADSTSLASVATSGLYSDLTGAPTIPTVYNGTLTIQKNGTNVQTFTANSSTNATANIETIYAVDPIDTSAVSPFVTNSMIDWSTFTINGENNAGSAQIGPLLIQWGRGSVTLDSSTPTESGKAITFSKAYTYTPFVTVVNEDISGVCGEFGLANSATVNGFTATIGRVLSGGSGTAYFKWMAVGISTS